MTEEQMGTEQTSDADSQTGVETLEDGTQAPAAEGNQDEITGLKTAAAAEREKRQAAEVKAQAAEATAQLAQEQLALVQANAPAQPKDVYEELGLDPEDVATVEQQRQIDAHRARQTQNQMAQMSNQQFVNSHPDFTDAVGAIDPYSGQLQASAELKGILAQKPHLLFAAYSSADAAYKIVMQEREIAELTKKAKVAEELSTAQKVANKTAAMSGAAAGGGSVTTDAAPKTREEVAAIEQQIEDGKFG